MYWNVWAFRCLGVKVTTAAEGIKAIKWFFFVHNDIFYHAFLISILCGSLWQSEVSVAVENAFEDSEVPLTFREIITAPLGTWLADTVCEVYRLLLSFQPIRMRFQPASQTSPFQTSSRTTSFQCTLFSVSVRLTPPPWNKIITYREATSSHKNNWFHVCRLARQCEHKTQARFKSNAIYKKKKMQ